MNSTPNSSVAADATSATVTLLTGDRVTLASVDASSGSVRPGENRKHIRFLTFQERRNSAADQRDLYVIPQDAQRLVRSGKLDRRLFNVSALIRHGYHDAARADLPLLVSYAESGARRSATDAVTAAGARLTRELPAIGGAAVTVGKERTTDLWQAITTDPATARADISGGVDRIWLDGKRPITLEHSVPQIGAPAAHQAGYTGQGVTVAVLDTGVDAEHPDLVGKVAEARNFTEVSEPGDTIGHGTHVASTIAGSGAASGGRYRGVAPDATLVSGKVCESTFCTDSAILAGMQWAAVEKQATVINFSIGGPDGPEVDPLEEAVNTLTEQTGTLFVIAAGNDGRAGSVGSPGSADAALTVGAVDRDDQLADFSSQGPRVGDEAVKPDLTAPGVDIVAAQANGTELGEPAGAGYVSASGTSMATPHVAGSVALLAQRQPDWTAGEFKAALTASAEPNPALGAYQQGAGRVDVARAITQTVTTDPVGLSFGRAIWPHGDDDPVTRTVIYRNTGTTDVTLDLALHVTGPDGATPPAGMFRASAESVTVPAGGEAQATVTTDTSVTAPDGHWSGRLTATGPAAQVTTALAVNKEVESYDLTLNHIGATGAPSVDYATFVLGLEDANTWMPYDDDGTVTLRLPKGRYGLTSWLYEPIDEERRATAEIVQPELELSGDTSVTLDTRRTEPVEVTVPDPSAVAALADVGHVFHTPNGSHEFSMLGFGFEGLSVGQIGTPVPADQFASAVSSQWISPDAAEGLAESPYLYAVGQRWGGRVPTGYVKHFRDRDLATVRQEFRGASLGGVAERIVYPKYPNGPGGWAIGLPTQVPGQRIEHYSSDGVRWDSELVSGDLTEDGWLMPMAMLEARSESYRAGRDYTRRWNTAPFGPSLPSDRFPGDGSNRRGDLLTAAVPLFGDSAGHIGYSATDTGRVALYRNGKLVGENTEAGWGEFTVPPARANYRLEIGATRSVSDLSTRIDVAWTFRSRHVGGGRTEPLPLLVVGFAPRLAVDNSAPAGRQFDIPVTVTGKPGTPQPRIRKVTVEVSYDDGRTWRPAKLRDTGRGWVATVRHPNGDGYASLRAKATDSAGNTVTQSTIHAYRLR